MSSSDLQSQINAYKHILKLSEELLGYAGIPEELKKKYDLVKEKTLEKFKSNALNDTMRTNSTKAGSDATIIEEFDSLLDIVYTSNNTLCDKIVSLLNYLTNFTTRSGVPDSQRTMYGAGLIADNKNQFYAKIKSLRDVDPGRSSDSRQNVEYYINNQVPRFEKLETRLLKYLGGIEDHILRNNEKVLEMEEIIDQLQRNEQKLKLEIDMISSKVNDARQIQSIEKMERNHDVQSQIMHLKDSLRKSEHTYDRQVTELKHYYEGVIGDLQDKLERTESSYSRRLDDVMDKDRSQSQGLVELEYYKDFADMVKREFQLFSDKYFATHSKSFDMKQGSRRSKDQLYDLVNFIIHLLQKFENDNLWLVDKLTDLGNENAELKKNLDASSHAKEEFDKLFKKLRGELQDSKAAFFEWENSIQGLKQSVEDERDLLKASDLA